MGVLGGGCPDPQTTLSLQNLQPLCYNFKQGPYPDVDNSYILDVRLMNLCAEEEHRTTTSVVYIPIVY